MTGSDATRVISIAGDPGRRETLSHALRDAGFAVTIVAPQESMNVEGAPRSGAGTSEGAPPQVRIVSRSGGAVALQSGDLEVLLPEHAQAAVLADAAQALLRWCAAQSTFPAGDASGARAGEAAMDPAQGVSAERSLAAVCHDLRTPLSVMVGWLHLMQSGKLDEAGMKRAIEKLHDSLREQVGILDRMLEVAEARRDGAPAVPPSRLQNP